MKLKAKQVCKNFLIYHFSMKRDFLYLALILFLILSWWFFGRPVPPSNEDERYKKDIAQNMANIAKLQAFQDSVLAYYDSLQKTIKPTTVITSDNDNKFKDRASAIRVLPPTEQVRHFSNWVSKADSLLR